MNSIVAGQQFQLNALTVALEKTQVKSNYYRTNGT